MVCKETMQLRAVSISTKFKSLVVSDDKRLMFGIWTNSRQLVCTARQKLDKKETAYSSSSYFGVSFF